MHQPEPWGLTEISRFGFLADAGESLLNAFPAAVYLCAADGRIVRYNDRAAEIWGRRPTLDDGRERFCGSFRIYNPDGSPLPHHETPMGFALRTGQPQRDIEVLIERPDGTRRLAVVNIEPLLGAANALEGAVNCFHDITDRRFSESAGKHTDTALRGQADRMEEAEREVRRRAVVENSLARRAAEQEALFRLTDRLHRAKADEEMFAAALEAIQQALECERASILLFDQEDVMRFVAWRGLSDTYREAVEGHSPWTPADTDAEPICIGNVATAELDEGLRAVIAGEKIGALAFIPLLAEGRVIGKFMAYYGSAHEFGSSEVDLALTIARQLGFGLARLRSDRARLEAELASRESERRLQLALEAGRMGAWEWNTESGEVSWSPSLERIHGLARGAFAGTFDDFRRDIHPDDVERVSAAVAHTLETRRGYHVDYRIVRPDGEIRWLEAFGRFVAGTAGRPALLAGVCMDVTERKHSEDHRDLLVAELSHRVKNTLATVMSIARQSFARAPSLDAARTTFEARLQALSQAHGRLAEANWSGVSLETLLSDELAPFRRAENIRLSGEPVTLSPKCALTLGLAVHELATNAAKYGALFSKDGRIRVEWSIDRSSRQLLLTWREEDGPPVVPPRQSGFGRLLLERALVSDLRGEVDMDFAAAGLICRIAVPADVNIAPVQ